MASSTVAVNTCSAGVFTRKSGRKAAPEGQSRASLPESRGPMRESRAPLRELRHTLPASSTREAAPDMVPAGAAASASGKAESAWLTDTIRLAQSGNAEAFEAIYREHSRRVYALCSRMSNDPVEAEDLTQEAFLQLFRKIHTFRGESAFSSWLYRLTANIVFMRFRRKKPVPASLDEMMRTDENSGRIRFEIGNPDLRLSGLFDRFNLQKAVARLPEGYKTMFVLHDVQGYEHNEIAALHGCSVGNSKSQLHKARKRLRELLTAARERRFARGKR